MSLNRLLSSMIREGDLSVRLPGGQTLRVGDGSGPPIRLAIADPVTAARIAANPAMAVGEAYMDGRLILEQGTVHDLLDLSARNRRKGPPRRVGMLHRWWDDMLRQRNARASARRNVHHHYDLSVEFYRLFLDEDLQYSCAYFPEPGLSLEAAQQAKKRHLAAKLLLEPGHKVLDIGCGWGGLGLTLAEDYGAQVQGVTLSTEQLATARQRAERRGVADRARFDLLDYRDVAGPFDRIVSVGMFEHVGRPQYQAYFDGLARLLDEDGVAVIHSIGRSEGPSITQPWVAKHIFPGGYIPALSEVLPFVERAGLIVSDIEILRLHYADTLKAWRARFAAHRAEAVAMYDERFARMWEFYLSASEVAFRHLDHMVFQLQLTRRIDSVPVTRDYITARERGAPNKAANAA
ncbi:MAG: cfa2 [Caulobacter sp.]|nr:cfa2 [Caulobacter sp.]